MRAIGLSATVAEPESLARFLVPQRDGKEVSADIVVAGGAAAPVVEMLDTKERLPWAGHTARHALGEMYELIKRNKTTLIFVNTRSQAEMLFQDFWRMNDDGLAIALHHGSLDVAQRRKVEDAMAAGKLRGVVCTSSLDLGIDWGDIDLVINVGAPKGSSRLMQRIGRANHRLDEPSRAVLIPANRFEVLECRVAIDAIAENAQDTPPLAHRRARRAGAARARLRLRRAVSVRRTLRGSADIGALRGADANRFRRRGRFRRHRRLRAENLRTLRAHQAGQAGPLARHQSAGAAELSPQRRHHRRRGHAEGAGWCARAAAGRARPA